MTSCVNKLSKEFKGLCSKFNVSPNTMELIIHKYWDERHNDRFYPSDAYIDAQLGNSPYKETLDAVIRVWNQKYTKPQVFKSSHDFIKARNEALKIFPNDALVSYRDSNKNFVFRIRKPVKNLKGEYKKALNNNGWGKKKNADSGNDARDIQLYIDNATPKKTTGQTYFTFKDGIRLQTPFTVNEQQANALNELDKFLDSDDNVITLSGYAGTGKTSLMQIFKQKALMKGHMVSFSATTNKAAAVLQSKVKNASTLHHLFGIQAGVDLNNEYDLSRLVNTINDENKLVPGQVVVIDEASMIGKPLYDMINQIANKEGVKIIYLGDKAQLAPVNETQISPIFKNPKGKVLELTKVERTGDNAILKEATAIRNGKGFSYDSSFNSEGKGVAFIDPSKDKKEVVDIIKHYAPLVKKDPDSFKILAYTNAKVAQYNNYIRKLLGYNTPVPRVGETIMGYKNWGYSKGKYKIINSENYKVTKVYDKPISEDIEGQSVEYYLVEVEDYEGNTKGIKLVDIKNNIKNRQAVTALGKKVSQLWSTYRSATYNNRREILGTINGIEQALFVNDDIKEGNRTIVQKAWDYGYAMTVHKSQGSTFKNVFIDDNDIQSARPVPILENAEDVGDFSDMAAILAEEGEDVGSLTNQEVNSNQDANNKPDLISQLEYVAVSRATDTATVLSNMTKKEGSPLHPEKLMSTQLSKSDNVSKSNTHTEPNKPTSSTITQQVVDHLKSIPGINVLGRSAMETFLKTHNVIGLQQAIENQNEMDSIKQKAIADGTFMKAPNGKKSNLSERQWLQVRTKAFKDWFGDWENDPKNASKVVDENGEPLVVYHGTNNDFNTFSKEKRGAYTKAPSATKAFFAASEYNNSLNYVNVETQDNIVESVTDKYDKIQEDIFKKYDTLIQGYKNYLNKREGKKVYSINYHEDNSFTREHKTEIQELEKELNFNNNARFKAEKEASYNYVKPLFLNIKNPKIDDDKGSEYRLESYNDRIIAAIQEGKDGGIIKNTKDPIDTNVYYFFEPNQAKSATINNGNFSTIDGNTQAAFDIDNSNVNNLLSDDEKNEIVNEIKKINKAKRSLIDTGGDNLYIVDHTDKDGFNHLRGNQEGFLVKTIIDIRGLDREQINKIKRDYENDRGDNEATRGLESWLKGNGYKQRILNSNSFNSENRESTSNNVRLDSKAQEGTSFREQGSTSGKEYFSGNQVKTGYDGTNHLRYANINDIETFTTPQGEVYGFVDKDGNIYLDETKISPNHPIHEYTHLWDRTVQQKNPKLWQRGVELMKQTSMWKTIANDAHYGKAWEAMNLPQEKLDNLIASEVHARLTGEGSEQLLNNLAKEKGQSNIIEKLKQWILDVWKDLKATFGSWSQEDLDSLTLKDFNHMTVRDFTNGVNLKAASTVTYTDSNNNENADLSNLAERPFTVKGDDIDAYDYEKDFSFKSVEAAYQAAKANYADLSEEEISKWIEKIQACNTAEEARKIGEQIPNLDTETWDKYSPSILKFLVKESFMQNPKAMQQLLNTDDSALTGKDKNSSNILIQARNELKNEINNNENDTINNEGQRSDVKNNNQTMSQEEIKNNILNILSKGAFTMTTNSSGDITDFNSIRQYYMYQKALAFGDDETADKILDAKNDNEVAKLNKQIKDVDVQQWAKLAPSIMRVGLLSLFEQNSEALKALINADHDTLSKIEEESKMGHGFTSFLESVQGELDTKYNKSQTDGNDNSQLDLNEPTDMSETKITLPAFRHFEYGDKVGSQQEVTVDAQWKVPILRSLDSMIYSPEDEIDEELMSPEQKANNKSLIIQIYAIMHMRDKHDYTDIKRRTKLYRDEREVYEQDLVDSQMNYLLSQGKEGNKANKVTVYNSFDDLKDSNLLSEASPSKIREIANMIMDYASSIITKLQTKDGYAKAMFPNIKAVSDGFDFKSASRQEVINAIGITNIFNKVREFFDPDKSPIREEYDKNGVADKLRMMVDSCWEAFLRIGEAQFQFNEGLRIKEDFTNKTFSTVEDNNTSISDDVDDFNENNDEDSLSEKVGDTQEAWQVDTLTRSVLQSMSTVVKSALHDCLQVDKNGKYITHPWFKVALRVDPVSATKSILYFTKGATTYESMVEKLSDAAKNKGNLWMNQLLKKLKDNTGKYTDFQSQFFTTFFKSKMPYAVTIDNNGTISSIQANSSIVLKSLMNEAITKFKTKRHPLFTSNGMNKQYLGSRNTVGEGYSFNLYQALEKICNTLSKYHQARLYTIDRDNRRKGLVAGTQHWNINTWGYFDFNGYSDEDITYMAKEFSKAFQVLGFNIDPDTIEMTLTKEGAMDMANTLQSIIKTLTKAADNPSYNPFDFKDGNSILSYLRKMIGIAVEPLEAVATNTVYNNGKTYQEYVTPSFLSKLLSKLGTTNGEELEANLEKNYAWSQFYCSGTDRDGVYRYRVPLLKKIAEQGGSLLFEHKINLSFNDHAYMKNMNSPEYALSVFAQYWAITKANGMEVAYYRIPMQSNKPTEDYIGTYCYRDPDYKENVKNDLYDMFLIELSRIQTVRMRNRTEKNDDYIKSFDDRGRKFCFFSFLNDYLDSDGGSLLSKDGSISPDDSELARLLQKKIKGEEALSSTEEVTLQDLTKKAFESYLNNKTANMLREWKRNGILKAARNINNILDPVYHEDIKNPYNEETNPELYRQRENEIDAIIAKYLENFIWNDYNMAKNILMVTVGDIAFYKDTEDLQKRLAQLHAPGVRARVSATDYQGNKVSDGYYRTLVLKDWDSYISNIKANLNEVFNELIEKAPDNMKSQYRALKENVLRAYSEINVADAEGYTGPTAYRKKALMFGRWSKEFENVYQKLMKGEHDLTTLKAAFQPLKPFVYSNQLKKDMGVEGAPIQTMACPFQAKNSEYLLIMADALMREHDTSRPNLLKAIADVMEDSAFDGRTRNEDGSIENYGTYNGRGIDTIQSESAIKSSLQGAINIFDNANDEKNGTKEVYDKLMGALYKKGTHDYNTDLYVQEVPYEDYCLQQEVPDHFIDHEQAHGSQIRAIIPSDLEEYYDPQKEHNEENTVYYEWEEWQKVPSKENPDRLTWKKVKVKVNAQQYREMYENTIAANINMSIEDLKKELNLDTANRREANFALSKILKKEILSSSRYGLDMLTACSIDKETGEFKLPLGDPIQCKQFEQLLNSIIKNRVNKQKIPGGPVVQVSNFGVSKQLHIRFKDKTGNLIPLEEEYKAEEHNGMSYEEYCKENQDGIAYFEVFAPIWSQDLVDKFGDENGNIDIEAIEAVDPDLLKLITYRIPTEDKYSMAPCKIVGFLPREAGSTIMLPYELTTQDGSDFDIDKRYVMRKDLHLRLDERKMRNKVTSMIKADLVKSEAKRKGIPKSEVKVNWRSIRDNVDLVFDLMKQPNAERLLSPNEKTIAQYVDKLKNDKKLLAYCYSTDIPNGRTFNNNRIIDMSWAVLTHKTQANKVLNPGGFDEQKAVGYMIEAYKNFQGTWDELERVAQDKDGIKSLKKLSYKDKDLATFDTQLQFYKQNQAAGNTLGVFAVNKVSHALLESDHLYLKLSDILGSNDWKINIAGKTFSEYLSIDPSSDWYGNPIGKTLGSLVGASADAAKDPILNLMNINMDTVNILNAMLRTGVPFKIAALFLSQDIISKVLDETTKRNIDGYTSINNVVYEYVQRMTKENGFREGNNIYSEGLSTEELITGLREGDHASSDFKVLLAFQKFTAIVEALRKPTLITRFNSISTAVGPLAIDNLMTQYSVGNSDPKHSPFYKVDGSGKYSKIGALDIFNNHPILAGFYSTHEIANSILKETPAGSHAFKKFITELSPNMRSILLSDRKLLDKAVNFFTSYMLVSSGLINPNALDFYINEFPKKVATIRDSTKYKNNAFIDSIIVDTDRKTNKPYIRANLTGMDKATKEKLSMAWLDLYDQDSNLALDFFTYSFFRGGVGFSPRTFMSLFPNRLKKEIKNTLSDGTIMSYNDVYRKMSTSTMNNAIFLDQFIRHNVNSNKLVPLVSKSGMTYDPNTKSYVITSSSKINELSNTPYFKTKNSNNDYDLWRFNKDKSNGDMYVYELTSTLGNNGEYLEMNKTDIKKSLAETTREKGSKNLNDNIESNDAVPTDISMCIDLDNGDTITEEERKESYEELSNEALDFADRITGRESTIHKTNEVTQEENKDRKLITDSILNSLRSKGFKTKAEDINKEESKLC